MTVLITGASGFIGKHLASRLAFGKPRLLIRKESSAGHMAGDLCDIGSLQRACQGIDTIFHCAGHAHAFQSTAKEDATLHWQINFEGTRNLVEAAAKAGVSRFVHLSSVKAMAEPGDECADESWPGEPETDYGRAKRAAEDYVMETAARTGMRGINLRLAMVYGPGGRGNLERMLRLVQRGLFPLLPETGNRRSLVYVADVVDAILLAGEHSSAHGTYIVADPQHYSGRQILDAIRYAVGRPLRRGAIPLAVLQSAARAGDIAGRIIGRNAPFNSEVLDKLLGSACYDSSKVQAQLGWRARTSLQDGLAACVAAQHDRGTS